MTTPTPAQADEKACPFCGSSNTSSGGDDKVVGRFCGDCGAAGPNGYQSDLTWNDRVAPEGEAVAWRYRTARWHDGQPGPWAFTDAPDLWRSDARYDVQSLFASPPAPAGVKEAIEALELARRVLTGRVDRSLADDLAVQRIDLALVSLLPPSTEAPVCADCGDTGTIPDRVDGEITCPACGYPKATDTEAQAGSTAEALPAGVEAEWLDIRSAPLDGTLVDLWVQPHDAEANGNSGRIADAWFSGRWMRFVPGEEGAVPVDRCGIPTHWRPRPSAPSTDKPSVFDTWKDIAGLLRSGVHDRALMTKGAIVIETLAEELASLSSAPAQAGSFVASAREDGADA